MLLRSVPAPLLALLAPFALLAFTARALPAAQQATVLPRPDPALQAAIRKVTAPRDEADQASALAELRERAGPAHAALVPQLFLFSFGANDTREGMALGVVLDALAVPAGDVVRALVPLLESEDPAVRAEVGNVLSEYEDRSIERGPDFGVYRPYLEGEPPVGLVRHLFEVDPGAALLALARAQVREPTELRALVWAEHEIADVVWKLRRGFRTGAELARTEPEALEQLALLARHPRWWARLHAARTAADEPALRTAVSLDELANDPHPLVRATASAIR
jgi:hypothetical protein